MVLENFGIIGKLLDLPGLMFNEEWGNLKVVVDGGELTRNNDRKRKSKVNEILNEIEVSMLFLVVTFFEGR